MPTQIIQQIQPTKSSCTQTCVAMLLGEPVDEVVKVFGDCGKTEFETLEMLEKCGIVYGKLDSQVLLPINEIVYMMVVPSLNLDKGCHAILVQYTDKEGFKIYDPNKGRENKRFYGEQSEGGEQIVYKWDVKICMMGGRLPKVKG